MNSASHSILVLGAGELGLEVLRHLAKRVASSSDAAFSVLLRPATIDSQDPDKGSLLATLRSLGVRFVPGDLANDPVEALADSFASFHTVVGCTGFVGGPGVQRKIASAVLSAGVARYVPWQFGVDYDVIGRGSAQDLFDEQLDVRGILRSQNRTAWIIISTGMFTSFLFEPAFGVVDLAQNTVHALGSWNNAVTVTTSEDIGALTAEILFAEPPVTNQIVYTAGDTITYTRLADTVDAVLGRRVQREEWTLPRLKDELAADPENAVKKYRVVFAEERGVSWEMARTFNAQRKIKTVDVEQWAQENLL